MNGLNAKTLIEALQSSANSSRSITYINGKDDEKTVSYNALWDRALRMLGYLSQNGVAPRNELILYLQNNEQFIDVFWGALTGGIVPVPLAVGAGDVHHQKLFNVFRKLNNPVLYSTEKNLKRLKKYADNNDLSDAFERIKTKVVIAADGVEFEQKIESERVEPEDTAFIQFSSGSTGEPKGVVLSHKNLMTNVRAILQGMDIREAESFLSWMPLTHDMGIIGFHLVPLVAMVNSYLMPTELFVRRPMLWVQKISEKRATVTSSPNFGYKYLLKRFKAGPGELDLSCIRLVFNGAEPISAQLCNKFYRAMAPFGYRENAMFPVYGLAEATLAATFPRPEGKVSSVHVRRGTLSTGTAISIVSDDQDDALELVRVGFPLAGSELVIVDADDKPLGANIFGRVLIRGDNVTSGYYDDAELNSQIISNDGWLDTGDLGFINQGQLVVAGRAKDLIIVNGQNFHPHDLEVVCEKVDGIELGKVAAYGIQTGTESVETLVVFILFRGGVEDFLPMAQQIKRLLNEAVGVDVGQVVPVPNIPKTTSGKAQRYLLAEQYMRGDYRAVVDELNALMFPVSAGITVGDSTERILLRICNSIIDDRKVGLKDNLFEIGANSLKLAQIHEQIEALFPGQIEVTDLFDYPTVSELAIVLEGK